MSNNNEQNLHKKEDVLGVTPVKLIVENVS